ncbi:Tetratricopeptide repeat protein 14 [Podila humilis]|nr:Tetratricopeptide repeat protein 14 [Podila humilis]
MQQHQTQTAQPAQSSQQQQLPLHGQTLSNIDAALEGVINKFVRSEKNARKFKYIVRGTSAPGRQNYKFPQATGLTAQETKLWRQNLMQDETASNNPFWTARWMRVFRVAPRLDDSLLKVPYVKCERTKAAHGDSRAPLPLHRKETYIDLRDEQNHNWAMDSYTAGIQNAQKGQLNNALKAYSQSIHIDSKFVEAYIARGCTLANMSKYKEAIMDFQQALSLQPGNDQARQYLESTIAQEEHVKRNPHQISANQAQSTPTQPGSGRAYYEKSNLDDINEIVMETDAVLINDMPGNDQSKGNKKKKKKKSKGKRVPDDIDRYQPNEEQPRSPVRNKSQHSPRKMSHSPLRRRAKSPAMKKQDTSTSTQPRPKSPVGQASAKHSEAQ